MRVWCCETMEEFSTKDRHLEIYEDAYGVAGFEFIFCPFCGKELKLIKEQEKK